MYNYTKDQNKSVNSACAIALGYQVRQTIRQSEIRDNTRPDSRMMIWVRVRVLQIKWRLHKSLVSGERERCESLDQAPLKGGRDDKKKVFVQKM